MSLRMPSLLLATVSDSRADNSDENAQFRHLNDLLIRRRRTRWSEDENVCIGGYSTQIFNSSFQEEFHRVKAIMMIRKQTVSTFLGAELLGVAGLFGTACQRGIMVMNSSVSSPAASYHCLTILAVMLHKFRCFPTFLR